MKRVLDRLMLSSLSEANDAFFLKQHDVQAILYFGSGGMFRDDIKLYYRPALQDGTLSPDMIKDGITFLRESLHAGRRVLAVGPSGSTIVASYLTEMGMSHQQALQMLGDPSVPQPDADLVASHAFELERRSSITLGHR